MAVRDEFPEDNLVRATRHSNAARVVAHVLRSKMRELFPNVIDTDVVVSVVEHQGWCNLSFWVDATDGSPLYVLRLCERDAHSSHSSSRSIPKFEKERFVLDRLSSCDFAPRVPSEGSGIINLEIPGRGIVPFGYLFQTQLPFEACRHNLGERERHEIFWRLGEVSRQIHSITLEGFGTDFDESKGMFRHSSYHEMLAANVGRLEIAPIDPMFKRWLTSRLSDLAKHDPSPCLYHQDLLANWGNMLVDSSRRIRGVVDWEFAGSGLPFHNEIASFLYVNSRDGVSEDRTSHDLLSLLDGYGVSHASYVADYEQDIQTLVLSHAVSALLKMDTLVKNGGLHKEPWRKVFAERATALCHRAIRSRT